MNVCGSRRQAAFTYGHPLYLAVAMDMHCGHHKGASVQSCADALAAALAIVAMFPLCAKM